MGATEFVKAINEPICKLIDHISNGIGVAYEPHRIKKMADAEAYRIGVLGKAISENENLPIQYNGEKLLIDATQYEELQKRAAARFVHQETQRQFNIENIADKACDLLKDVTDCSKEPISDDWMSRFIIAAQDVSDEDVQNMWAKILAGEIQRPGKFSMRTLDVLRNLSKKEAEEFKEILPYIIRAASDCAFVSCEKDLLDKYKITYSSYITLDTCGLLKLISHTSLTKTIEGMYTLRSFYTTDRLLAIENTDDKIANLSINNIFLLTEAGFELSNALLSEKNNQYFEDWVRTIKKTVHNDKLIFSIHESIESERYNATPIITL